MKNIFKVLSIAAIALVMASCNKDVPSKADVEKGFTPFKGGLPTLSISPNIVCDAVKGIAEATVTISGLDPNLDSLSVGILSCTDDKFATTKFTPVKNPKDGTVVMKAQVSANKTYYLKAVAATLAGSSYSDVVVVDVPDIPFWAKLPGDYAASAFVSDAYGDKYENNVISIYSDTSDPEHTCWIYGLDPYYQANQADFKYPEFFTVAATIDNDARTVTVAVKSQFKHYKGGLYSIAGFDTDHLKTATTYAPLVFKAESDDVLFREKAFATLQTSGDIDDAYEGGVRYTRK